MRPREWGISKMQPITLQSEYYKEFRCRNDINSEKTELIGIASDVVPRKWPTFHPRGSWVQNVSETRIFIRIDVIVFAFFCKCLFLSAFPLSFDSLVPEYNCIVHSAVCDLDELKTKQMFCGWTTDLVTEQALDEIFAPHMVLWQNGKPSLPLTLLNVKTGNSTNTKSKTSFEFKVTVPRWIEAFHLQTS